MHRRCCHDCFDYFKINVSVKFVILQFLFREFHQNLSFSSKTIVICRAKRANGFNGLEDFHKNHKNLINSNPLVKCQSKTCYLFRPYYRKPYKCADAEKMQDRRI